jgi:two-component system, HptB-dependent secretion and biofilm response regulator
MLNFSAIFYINNGIKMAKHPKTEKKQSNLFDHEEHIIAQAATMLQNEALDPQQLREAFVDLLKHYRTLSRQSERLNRINDRSQLALRNSKRTLNKTLAELRIHQEKLAIDQEMVEEILEKMHSGRVFEEAGLRHLLIPIDNASGDLLFSSRRPDGARHILLGDTTGHGLPAAIVGPAVSDVFYTMTLKGFTPGVILAEINQRLRGRLPTGIYLATALLELDESNQHMSIWNGGLPEGLLFRDNKVEAHMHSNGFPLGIVENSRQNWSSKQFSLEPGDRIVLYSDGIIEGRNQAGEMFGAERFEQTLLKIHSENQPMEMVVEIMKKFVGSDDRIDDDITIVEITC